MYKLKTMAHMNVSNNTSDYYSNFESPKKKSPIFLIITLSILSVIILSILIFNIKVFKTHGSSMSPTLKENDLVVSHRVTSYQRGDLIAFHHNNAIMIKRIIALPGETINIKDDGTVTINNNVINEPYLTIKDKGYPDIDLPYMVKNDTYFVMGDNRGDSLDSRDVAIGCIKETDIIGKVDFSLIPFGTIK